VNERGYTLVEVLSAIAIFMVFLFVLVGLQREFLKFDRENRVQMFTHPAPLSVLARLQRDIKDTSSYPSEYEEWSQGPATLLLRVAEDEGSKVVVWDFSEPQVASRLQYADGNLESDWTARAVPQYEIGSFDVLGVRTAVRIRAFDETGRLAVDRIVIPRID
jgi:hypothetical protein